MKYKLGKKYVAPKPNVISLVIASLFATIQVTVLMSLTFLGSLMFSLVLSNLKYLILVVMLLALLWIPFIYKKCMYRTKVLDVEIYRIINALLFAFVCIPISFGIVSYIVTNMNEGVNIDNYHFRGVAVTTKQAFSFILSEYSFVVGKVMIVFPKIVTMIAAVLVFLYLEYRILTLKLQDMIYIKSEKKVAFPKYQFTLVDEMNKVDLISYEYLRRLEVDTSSKVVANKLYYDVYTYGDGKEQYFFIEYYLTKNKDGKVIESKRKTSPIYEYDITNFDEQGLQNTTKVHIIPEEDIESSDDLEPTNETTKVNVLKSSEEATIDETQEKLDEKDVIKSDNETLETETNSSLDSEEDYEEDDYEEEDYEEDDYEEDDSELDYEEETEKPKKSNNKFII